jgi:hypothetical protein
MPVSIFEVWSRVGEITRAARGGRDLCLPSLGHRLEPRSAHPPDASVLRLSRLDRQQNPRRTA